jgi:hypothetical protein
LIQAAVEPLDVPGQQIHAMETRDDPGFSLESAPTA